MDLAINLTFVGITVVFLALIILSLSIYVFSKIIESTGKKNINKATEQKNESSVVEIDEKSSDIENSTSNEELVAVITAAVMACMKRTPGCKIQVKSFRRIPQTSPAWNIRGRNEYINNKL